MNLKYLGDALDHWKGALLDRLVRAGALVDLGVYPMATDHDVWTEADYAIYADLLRVPPAAVQRARLPLRSRAHSLGGSPHKGDAFLDPDTGIATAKVRRPEQYVYPADVVSLLFNGTNRVVVVYQHVRAARVADRVDQVVGRMPPDLEWASYESGSVAMLFFSLVPWRTDQIAESIRAYLGRHADKRVRLGSTGAADSRTP
jgi:hypothetical protein